MSVLEPSKIPVPFATSGLKNPIPANSDPVTGRAGYNQGFPAINMTAKEAGGIPPYGQDFNGILFDITNTLRFTQQGGFYTYDNSFATAIGGYKKGSVIIGKISAALYQNQIDGNLTDPEGESPSGWCSFGPNSYGVPMIGELVFWPSVSMPQEIWPDIGAKFIPYMGQPFSKELYPKLAQLHPSGLLPADMRGEFARGWDNGRGVDANRVIMSAQSDAMQDHGHKSIRLTFAGGSGGSQAVPNSASNFTPDTNLINNISSENYGGGVPRVSTETRPRSIAWNMIVRAA